MKFKDIQKLIHVGNGFDVDLGSIESTLEHYQEDYGFNIDPDFQRGHVWTTQQQIKFVEFVLKGGVSSPILFNSPAYGGYDNVGDMSDEIVVVDGKQRLTALRLFLNGVIPAFGSFISEYEDCNYMLRTIWIKFSINRIQTRKEILNWYLELNEGHIAHSPEELERVRNLIVKEN